MQALVTQNELGTVESLYRAFIFKYADATQVLQYPGGGLPPVVIFPPPPLPAYLDSNLWVPLYQDIELPILLKYATHKKIYFAITQGPGTGTLGDVRFRGSLNFFFGNEPTCQIPIFYRLRNSSTTTIVAELAPTITQFPITTGANQYLPDADILGFENVGGANPDMVYQGPVHRICNADRVILRVNEFHCIGNEEFWGYLVILNEYNY